jgi:hypothetical protein
LLIQTVQHVAQFQIVSPMGDISPAAKAQRFQRPTRYTTVDFACVFNVRDGC